MKKKLISILLTLVLVLSLMPAVSLRAYAYEGNPYTGLVNTTTTVKFNNLDWYIIKDESSAVDAGTVTLLAKDPIGLSKFDASGNLSNDYGISTIKTNLDTLTKLGGSFAGVANAIVGVDLTDVQTPVNDAKLWLLSKDEANALPENVRNCGEVWWLRTPQSGSIDSVL
ncbi:MAG: hypothetical protein ILP08_02290, partial [Lachnospiraceae bacterium]|nr:hypothetical protein [Lachnospiraceae bacterium]